MPEKAAAQDSLAEAAKLLAGAGQSTVTTPTATVTPVPSGIPTDAASALAVLKASGVSLASAPAPGTMVGMVPSSKGAPAAKDAKSYLPVYKLTNGSLMETAREAVDPAKFPANRIVLHTTSATEAKQFGLSNGGMYWFRTNDKGELMSVVVVGQALPGELFGQTAGTSFFFSNGAFRQVRQVQQSQSQIRFVPQQQVFFRPRVFRWRRW